MWLHHVILSVHEGVHKRLDEADESDQLVVSPNGVVLDSRQERHDALAAGEGVDQWQAGSLL